MFFLKINISKILQTLRLFKYAYGNFRRQIVIVAILDFVGGLAGGIGISMLIPLFSFLSKGSSLATDSISRWVQSIFSLFHLSYNLPLLLIFMFLLIIAKAVFLFGANYYTVKIASSFTEEKRNKLMGITLGASWPFLINQKVGYLDRVVLDDTSNSTTILRSMSGIFLRFSSLVIYAVIAFKISAFITAISLISGAGIFFLFKPLLYQIRKFSKYFNLINKKTAHFINESMIGMKTIKASATQSEITKQGGFYFDLLAKNQRKLEYLGFIHGGIFEPAVFLFITLILIYYYRMPNFNIASFAVTIYLIEKIFSFIQNIQSGANAINSLLPYLDTMIAYQKEASKNQERSEKNNKFKFENNLNFENTTFRYPNQKEHAFFQANFEIKKGEMVGIIGPSGAGKTTLVDLLLRLLNPNEGAIKLDGKSINDFNLVDWRKNLGYVSQDVFLFNDTLEANIRFYDPSISQKDIISATKAANIYDYIENLPDKFKTVVGERGLKLSGGQRQRIALARVLAKKPEILILDEATSSLDNESEVLIQKAIMELKGRITVLIIAHRLSTVMNSDKLIVLEKGKIIEIGAPEELMKKTDSYLYKSHHLRNI